MQKHKIQIGFLLTTLMVLVSSVGVSARIPDIVLKQRKAVVTIYINDKDGKRIANASGFIIDSSGTIVTNYHVVSKLTEDGDADSLLVKLENGAYYPMEKILATDEDNDVAIFKVDGKELPATKLAKNYRPKQGEDIVVIGSPLGLETTVSDGIISSVRTKEGIIQITAAISPGSSGSPVFNSKGEVVGIATFLIKGGQNLNFAVPVSYVTTLVSHRKPISPRPLPADAQRKKPVPDDSGSASPREGKHLEFQGGRVSALDWYVKGLVSYNAKRWTEAREEFAKAIELKPDFEDAYFMHGVASASLGDHHQAIKGYTKATELKPDFCDAYINRAITYRKLGDYQKAIEDYTKVIELRSNDARYYYLRGRTYDDLGNRQQAIDDFKKAAKLGEGEAQNFLEKQGIQW